MFVSEQADELLWSKMLSTHSLTSRSVYVTAVSVETASKKVWEWCLAWQTGMAVTHGVIDVAQAEATERAEGQSAAMAP